MCRWYPRCNDDGAGVVLRDERRQPVSCDAIVVAVRWPLSREYPLRAIGDVACVLQCPATSQGGNPVWNSPSGGGTGFDPVGYQECPVGFALYHGIIGGLDGVIIVKGVMCMEGKSRASLYGIYLGVNVSGWELQGNYCRLPSHSSISAVPLP